MIKLLTDKIPKDFQENGETISTFINPYSYLLARSQPQLFKNIDTIYLDGFLMVKLLGFLGLVKTRRMSFDFSSLAGLIFENAQASNSSIYFIGTKSGLIEQAVDNIKMGFPFLKIAGFRGGYFADEIERTDEIKKIAQINPDYVICGMGTPLQELLLMDLRLYGWQGIGYTCGGFLHQTAKKQQYYPQWVDRLNLRWLYRIFDEPKLLKRYILDYSKFIFVFIYDLYKYKFKPEGNPE
jgi:N-acetylglucosaminyldiphosphoundecaprenol N-acetyl-beta-D-mannosaminyltransferase